MQPIDINLQQADIKSHLKDVPIRYKFSSYKMKNNLKVLSWKLRLLIDISDNISREKLQYTVINDFGNV